jgi:hypothetical protein
MGSPERKENRVVSARVIKWDEDNFGIAIETMRTISIAPTSSGLGNRRWPRP